MATVFADITMSLDGFVTAPGVGREHPLGEGGERLHDWLFLGAAADGADRRIADEYFAATGAFVMGRRTFDVGEECGYPLVGDDDGAFGLPCFVLTHRYRPPLVKGSTTFTFVTDGAESALAGARAAAGARDVCVMGGADTIRQCLRAGQIDELRIHIAPILLGGGTRLFEGSGPIELAQTGSIPSLFATHLRFRVLKGLVAERIANDHLASALG